MSNPAYLDKLEGMPDWPALMRREVACRFIGPMSSGEFDKLINAGIIPAPAIVHGKISLWRKSDLENAGRRQKGHTAGTEIDAFNAIGNMRHHD